MWPLVALILPAMSTAMTGRIVEIDNGKIMGAAIRVLEEDKPVDAYLGIPYAAAPTGALRFKEPIPPPPWKPYVLQATKKGPACIQFTPAEPIPGWVARANKQNEDCLYLNVWTPRQNRNTTELKTVLVWIHGGGLNFGSASMDLYDGAILAAAGNVVVVSMNYRLGSFGFMALRNGANSAPGNQGLLDQVLALKWVQANIDRFGGDPKSVTVFGESAGAWSISLHVMSPFARPLFHRAIIQSGSAMVSLLTESAENVEEKALSLADSLGCGNAGSGDVVGCLQNKTAREVALMESFICDNYIICFGPIYGDAYLPRNPLTAPDVSVPKDILLGNVENEGSVFVSLKHWPQFPFRNALNINKEDMRYFFHKSFLFMPRAVRDQIYELYLENVGEQDYSNLRAGLGHAVGDAFLRCPVIFLAELLSKHQSQVFYYNMVYHTKRSAYMDRWLGMTHFEDLQYVFGLPLRHLRKRTYTDTDAHYSRDIINIWTTFAKTGKPPQVNGKPWETFDVKKHMVMSLDYNSSRLEVTPELQKCCYWEAMMSHNFQDSVELECQRRP